MLRPQYVTKRSLNPSWSWAASVAWPRAGGAVGRLARGGVVGAGWAPGLLAPRAPAGAAAVPPRAAPAPPPGSPLLEAGVAPAGPPAMSHKPPLFCEDQND